MHQTTVQPKFKLREPVSFKPHEAGPREVPKTFVWDISSENGIDFYYLIQHPDGLELTDQSANQFIGYNVIRLKQGIKYLSASEKELTSLESNVSLTQDNTAEINPSLNVPINVTLTKGEWETVALGMGMYETISKQQKALILMQGLTEQQYQLMLADIEVFKKAMKTIGIEP